MGILDNLKDFYRLASDVNNVQFQKQLVELQRAVHALEEENRALKAEQATKQTLTFKKNMYWSGEDGPFCSQCWDTGKKLVRMHLTRDTLPQCPACKHFAPDPDEHSFHFG